ncbi:hypothetical protein [Roseibium algae]|uniref:Uncharacterized protein n=1 Tax=Roseibium algae TaxID=3123038 RepID=A0ABU8TM92_9HYPH
MTDLNILVKEKMMMLHLSKFMKRKGLVNEWAFVFTNINKEKQQQIYHKFFAPSPKVKLKYMEKHSAAAQRLYETRKTAAEADGKEGNDAILSAVNSDQFAALLKNAQNHVRDQYNEKIVPEFFASSGYRDYVYESVDGSVLADEVKYAPSAKESLANAKVCLLLGEKTKAKGFAEQAIKFDQKVKQKTQGLRDKMRVPKANELLAKLDKIKIEICRI